MPSTVLETSETKMTLHMATSKSTGHYNWWVQRLSLTPTALTDGLHCPDAQSKQDQSRTSMPTHRDWMGVFVFIFSNPLKPNIKT